MRRASEMASREMPPSFLLAIDTSTRVAGIALCDGQDIEAEHTWQSEMNHTVELFPAIQQILRTAGLKIADLGRLAVAIGPGSFNGLRVGLSTAKALSFGLGIPLVGVSTLETQAFQHSWCGRPVCSLLKAGREEVAAAIFERRNGDWIRILDEQITTSTELAEKIEIGTVITGEIDERLASDLMTLVGSKEVTILPAEARLRRAGFLASLGWQRHEAGLVDDPASIQPLYLRRPPITMRQKP